MRLKFTATALKDLHRLKEFISKKNPVAATKYINQLLKVIRQLLIQPKLGKVIDERSEERRVGKEC